MDFSINFSTQAAVLLSQGRLKIDRFKCPDWPGMIAEAGQYRPVAVHFNLNAGRGKLARKDLDQVYRLAEQTQTPFVNLHLEAKTNDFPGMPQDAAHPDQVEQVFRVMVSEVELAVKRFGSQRVMIENVPYRPAGNVLRLSVEPELITRIVEETGCGLLLDIAHARIAAFHLGLKTREYLRRLPTRSLKEMHFTGVMDLGGWLQDHLPAQEEDWQDLEWALDQIRRGEWPRPWMLAFEYGGVGEKFTWRSSGQVIESQGQRLYRLVNPI